MKIFTHDNKKYYMLSHIKDEYEELFPNRRIIRSFVAKHNVPIKKYVYARHSEGELTVYNDDIKGCKIFILVSWFDDKFCDIINKKKTKTKINGSKTKKEPKTNGSKIKKEPKTNGSKKKQKTNGSKKDLEDTYEIIELDETEKFIDTENNIIEIETRGRRHHEKCYFKVSDIRDGFGIDHIKSTIVRKNSSYIPDVDYIYIIIDGQEKLFLTYEGLLRLLFTTRCINAKSFTYWAIKTLFSAQLGTVKQKNKLCAKLLGVTPDDIKHVFKPINTSISGIYLFLLGTVKDLRESLNIGDEYADTDLVFKYGYTDSLLRRAGEHQATFSVIEGCNLRLEHFELVDPQFLSKAELGIKKFISNTTGFLDTHVSTEITIVPSKKTKELKEQFKLISNKFVGTCKQLSNEITELKSFYENQLLLRDLEMAKKETELSNKETELSKKETELSKKETELLRKDLEIEKLKNGKR